MAIHSALPNDLGLVLWSAWSAEDLISLMNGLMVEPCERLGIPSKALALALAP